MENLGLVNAMVLLCMFHFLCGLSYGLGVIAEPDIMHLVFTSSSEGGLARDKLNNNTSPIISRGMIMSPPQSPLLSPHKYVDDMELKGSSSGSSLVFPDTPKRVSPLSLILRPHVSQRLVIPRLYVVFGGVRAQRYLTFLSLLL